MMPQKTFQLIKDIDSYLELKDILHTSFIHLSRLRARVVPRSDGCVLAAGTSAQLVSGPQLPGQGSHYIAAWCAVGDELILGLGSKTAIISHCEIIPFL